MENLPRSGFWLTAAFVFACGVNTADGPDGVEEVQSRVAAEMRRNGTAPVSPDEVAQELRALPAVLRGRFDTPEGREEIAQTVVDRRLMLKEALRRNLHRTPEFHREVMALEERLLLTALMKDEERAARPADEEARRWYDAHKNELKHPDRLGLLRILVKAGGEPGSRAWRSAQKRAEDIQRRLQSGERFESVAAAGDGPESRHGGAFGSIALGSLSEDVLNQAIAKLQQPGDRTSVLVTRSDFVIFALQERHPGAPQTFEEARAEIQKRLEPERKRRVFDSMLQRLRQANDSSMTVAVAP